MNFDRYAGMASAVGIVLILTLNGWLGFWGPIWHADWKTQPSDWLGLGGALFGSICTISAGWLAYSAVQTQIRMARIDARATRHAVLTQAVIDLGRDIDKLCLAAGFLSAFTEQFPPTDEGSSDGGFTDRLREVRWKALDYISASASGAPYGYGERISTLMARIQRIGDRMDDQVARGIQPPSVVAYYDPIIKNAIAGLRELAADIQRKIPAYREDLIRIADERDRFV
jgi:hypothetical protein